MARVGVDERAVGAEDAAERREEARFDAAAEQALVQPAHERRAAGVIGRFRAEHPEDRGREERGGRALAGDVTENEAEAVVRRVEVVEEVAANRAAGD